MTINYDKIPAELREQAIWLLWKYETVNERITKVPYQTNGAKASSTKPATWTSFENAVKALEAGGYDGLGVGISGELAAVDIDDCVDELGMFDAMAEDIIATMDTYTEYSPSGKGLRLFFKAPGFEYDKARFYINNQKVGLEVYIAGCTHKYLTVTGNVVADKPIAERCDAITAVLEEYMARGSAQPEEPAKAPTASTTASISDWDIVDLIRKSAQAELFKALFDHGDYSMYLNPKTGKPDHNAGDLALCNILAFWTRRDAAQMDRLFRNSGLMRGKWDEKRGATTYGQMTVDKAIRDCKEVYDPLVVHTTAQQDFKATLPTKPTEPTTNPDPPKLDITTASSLMEKEFPPLIQAVDKLICEGLTMLVAASKVGKSWLALYMALCVAQGKPFLARETTKCRVLYFALEDSLRRLQSRLQTISPFGVPANLFLVTKAQMLDTGFLAQVEDWITSGEGPALVIVDTLQKVRGVARKGVNAYEGDYDVVGGIKALADKYRAMIVCIHHTNKAKNVTDMYDKVSGSTGIMGAADTTILIDRERGQDTATVHFEGRDVYGDDFVIRFENGRWELMHNNALEFKAGVAYEEEPLVQLFRKLITENPNGGRWAYSKLQAIGLELLGYQPFIDGRDCARKLNDDGLANELRKRDKIIVETAIQTTGGKGIRLQQINNIVAFPTKLQIDEPTSPTEPT